MGSGALIKGIAERGGCRFGSVQYRDQEEVRDASFLSKWEVESGL